MFLIAFLRAFRRGIHQKIPVQKCALHHVLIVLSQIKAERTCFGEILGSARILQCAMGWEREKKGIQMEVEEKEEASYVKCLTIHRSF